MNNMRNSSLKRLAVVAMLIALAFILERFLPVVNLPAVRITLSFIPVMFCGMIFGPVWAAVAYGVSDIIGWPLMGLMPIPLVLVSRIISGFFFGLFLHRENAKFWPHAVICAFATQIVCGAGLTTLGLSLFFGNPFLPMLWSRVPAIIASAILQMAVFPLIVKLRGALRKAGQIAPYLK